MLLIYVDNLLFRNNYTYVENKKVRNEKSIVVFHLIPFVCLIENKYHVLQLEVCSSRSNCYIDPSRLYK